MDLYGSIYKAIFFQTCLIFVNFMSHRKTHLSFENYAYAFEFTSSIMHLQEEIDLQVNYFTVSICSLTVPERPGKRSHLVPEDKNASHA